MDWICVECGFSNIDTVARCDMCDTSRPREDASTSPSQLSLSPSCPCSREQRKPLCEIKPNLVAERLLTIGERDSSPLMDARPFSPVPTVPPAASAPFEAADQQRAADDEQFGRHGFPWSDELLRANECVFGSGPLRLTQLRAVNAALSGRDVLVVLPTGAGKSRCFQLPALLSPGLTVVVAPLLSLIHDQMDGLAAVSVRAAQLTSSQTLEESSRTFSELRRSPPSVKLLYLTPERLQQNVHLLQLLQDLHAKSLLARFVVDEAHCVVSWGRDFRPDYLMLGQLRRQFVGVPWTLLSGTLPPDTRTDLLASMGMQPEEMVTVETSLNRSNLRFEVMCKGSRDESLRTIVRLLREPLGGEEDAGSENGGMVEGGGGAERTGWAGDADRSEPGARRCAIVYCLSQAETERVCDGLLELGISAAFYHSQAWGMGHPDRQTRSHPIPCHPSRPTNGESTQNWLRSS